MEAEDPLPPSKIARHALYGTLSLSLSLSLSIHIYSNVYISGTGSSSGLRRSIDKYVGLRLELGCSSSSSRASSSSGFSFLQLQELEHQALIYAYMEAGLSVPHHLLLPIWKSVATSFTTQLNASCPLLHQQSPNQCNFLAKSNICFLHI